MKLTPKEARAWFKVFLALLETGYCPDHADRLALKVIGK